MIPNSHPDFDRKLKDLCNAIKCVYASTYYRRSKDYLRATNHMVEEEKMAVIIQQVTGTTFGQYCYPNVSGVARSLNYYPLGKESPEDGIAYLAFGFGKTVVDNGISLRFSPKHPKRAMQLNAGQSPTSKMQTQFYALDMEHSFKPEASDSENLVQLDVADITDPAPLKYIASTYDVKNHVISDSPSAQGKKIITFAALLKYNILPVAKIIRELLQLGEHIMNVPIEIEFACNFNKPSNKKPEFSILQIRPIVEGAESADVSIDQAHLEDALIYSKRAMGNGTFNDLYDIVYIKPEHFDPAKTLEMAQIIAEINEKFIEEDKGYILLVAGRLGSSDPWLGIPTTWSQISQAKVIIETGLPGFEVEPSQGPTSFRTSPPCIMPI